MLPYESYYAKDQKNQHQHHHHYHHHQQQHNKHHKHPIIQSTAELSSIKPFTVEPVTNQHYNDGDVIDGYDTTSDQPYRQSLTETAQTLAPISENIYQNTVTSGSTQAQQLPHYEDSYKNELNSITNFKTEPVRFIPTSSEIPVKGKHLIIFSLIRWIRILNCVICRL